MPNDLKLSDRVGWRGACPTTARTKTALNANTLRAKIARAVTAVAVRCSAWLGVAVIRRFGGLQLIDWAMVLGLLTWGIWIALQ